LKVQVVKYFYLLIALVNHYVAKLTRVLVFDNVNQTNSTMSLLLSRNNVTQEQFSVWRWMR